MVQSGQEPLPLTCRWPPFGGHDHDLLIDLNAVLIAQDTWEHDLCPESRWRSPGDDGPMSAPITGWPLPSTPPRTGPEQQPLPMPEACNSIHRLPCSLYHSRHSTTGWIQKCNQGCKVATPVQSLPIPFYFSA